MKLSKYIGDLLFEYECIVIPGFGGFITKSVPAEIQPIQNHFIPPKKEIVFNAHLKTNDGLLINYVARAEKLSYTDARIAVERFVSKCFDELNQGRRIRFQNVGLVFLGTENTLQFEPDQSQNYLADSFGLNSFISPAINRTIHRKSTTVKSPRKDRNAKYVVREEAKKQNAPKYIHVNISLIIILLAVASLTYFKFGTVKHYYHNYSSLVPFLDSSGSDKVVLDQPTINKGEPIAKVITLVDKLNAKNGKKGNLKNTHKNILNNKSDGTPNYKENSPKENQPDPKKETTRTKDPKVKKQEGLKTVATNNAKYFIIAGSFGNKANADKMMLRLKDQGFDASVLNTTNGSFRVALAGFSSMDAANKQLAIVRKEELANAWILSN